MYYDLSLKDCVLRMRCKRNDLTLFRSSQCALTLVLVKLNGLITLVVTSPPVEQYSILILLSSIKALFISSKRIIFSFLKPGYLKANDFFNRSKFPISFHESISKLT